MLLNIEGYTTIPRLKRSTKHTRRGERCKSRLKVPPHTQAAAALVHGASGTGRPAPRSKNLLERQERCVESALGPESDSKKCALGCASGCGTTPSNTSIFDSTPRAQTQPLASASVTAAWRCILRGVTSRRTRTGSAKGTASSAVRSEVRRASGASGAGRPARNSERREGRAHVECKSRRRR